MAKVEKVVQEAEKPKWEPFVTITLSKREAAGVAGLLANSSSRIATYELYRDLNDALGGTNDYGVHLDTTGSSEQSIELDKRFGEL